MGAHQNTRTALAALMLMAALLLPQIEAFEGDSCNSGIAVLQLVSGNCQENSKAMADLTTYPFDASEDYPWDCFERMAVSVRGCSLTAVPLVQESAMLPGFQCSWLQWQGKVVSSSAANLTQWSRTMPILQYILTHTNLSTWRQAGANTLSVMELIMAVQGVRQTDPALFEQLMGYPSFAELLQRPIRALNSAWYAPSSVEEGADVAAEVAAAAASAAADAAASDEAAPLGQPDIGQIAEGEDGVAVEEAPQESSGFWGRRRHAARRLQQEEGAAGEDVLYVGEPQQEVQPGSDEGFLYSGDVAAPAEEGAVEQGLSGATSEGSSSEQTSSTAYPDSVSDMPPALNLPYEEPAVISETIGAADMPPFWQVLVAGALKPGLILEADMEPGIVTSRLNNCAMSFAVEGGLLGVGEPDAASVGLLLDGTSTTDAVSTCQRLLGGAEGVDGVEAAEGGSSEDGGLSAVAIALIVESIILAALLVGGGVLAYRYADLSALPFASRLGGATKHNAVVRSGGLAFEDPPPPVTSRLAFRGRDNYTHLEDDSNTNPVYVLDDQSRSGPHV